MDHYDSQAERTNARCANENGDVESSNGQLKDRIDQALMLRGSRDFPSREEYMEFVEQIVARTNANRNERFREEMFPTTQFRIAYDTLGQSHTEKEADKAVVDALRHWIATGSPMEAEKIADTKSFRF